jgi:hypothetical protein
VSEAQFNFKKHCTIIKQRKYSYKAKVGGNRLSHAPEKYKNSQVIIILQCNTTRQLVR